MSRQDVNCLTQLGHSDIVRLRFASGALTIKTSGPKSRELKGMSGRPVVPFPVLSRLIISNSMFVRPTD